MSNQIEKATRTILLVEDDASHAEMLQFVLHSETPYQVVPFASAAEILEHIDDFKRHRPDLFLLDYKLPYLSGLDLYDQIHAIAELAHVPALLITASLSKELEAAAASRNLPLIYKPFEIDELLQAIQNSLVEA